MFPLILFFCSLFSMCLWVIWTLFKLPMVFLSISLSSFLSDCSGYSNIHTYLTYHSYLYQCFTTWSGTKKSNITLDFSEFCFLNISTYSLFSLPLYLLRSYVSLPNIPLSIFSLLFSIFLPHSHRMVFLKIIILCSNFSIVLYCLHDEF